MPEEPSNPSADHDELVCRLADELQNHPEDETLEFAELAEKLGVDVDEAARCAAAIAAMRRSFEEDFPEADLKQPDLPPPSLPDDYELLEEIGRGGMGIVYRVRQRSLDRTVAAKVLRPGELLFGNAARRFQQEARSLARLRHRHIVSVHEVGEAGGNVYFTMDLIDGEPLSKLIERRETTPARSVRLLRQVASAMAHAHSHGVIHRDLKPGNILVDKSGDAFVVDFGLARDVGAGAGDSQDGITRTGHVLGTPAYMSPEQARGDQSRIGESSDIYALGAVLYECLTNRPPFHGLSLAETVHAVIHREPTPPRRLNPSVPRDLEIICLKAMSKEPEHRYPTIRALLEDLERFEEGKTIRARRPKLSYRALRFLKRQRHASVSAVVAAAIVTLALLAVLLPQVGRTPESLLENGQELHDAGQHKAASIVFDNALEEIGASGSGDYSSPQAYRLLHLAVRCRNEEAARLKQQGDEAASKQLAAESVDLCQRGISSVSGVTWDSLREKEHVAKRDPATNAALVDLLWEKANASFIAGTSAETDHTLRILSGLTTSLIQDPEIRQGRVLHEEDIVAGILDRLLPALLDPQSPRHQPATRSLATLFSPGLVGLWISRQGESKGRLIQAYLSGFGRLPAVKAVPLEPKIPKLNSDPGQRIHHLPEFHSNPGWDRFYFHLALPEYAEIFEKAATDSALPAKSRSLATDLLCSVGDLPLRLPIRNVWELFTDRDHTGENPDAVLSHPELERLALGLWREVRDLSFVEGYRRRVESAIELYKPGAFVLEGKWEETWGRLRDEWFRTHTGLSHDFFKGSAEEQHHRLQEWWQEHRLEDPRAWLVRGLRLETIPQEIDSVELLDGLLHATDVTVVLKNPERMENLYDRDRLYDQLLRLTVSPKLHPPTPELNNFLNTKNFILIIQRWNELLQADVPAEPYVLRAVALGFRPGSLEPEILWQRTSVSRLQIEDELTVEFPRKTTTEIPETRWTSRGWDMIRMFPRRISHTYARSGVDRISVGLDYQTGLQGRWRLVLPNGGTGSFEYPVGGPLLTSDTAQTQTVFTVLEPPGSDPKPWTLDRLRQRIVDGLAFHAEHMLRDLPNEDERIRGLEADRFDSFYRLYARSYRCLVTLATMIRVPEATASLERLFRRTGMSRARVNFLKLEIRNLQARLLAGEDVFSDLKTHPWFDDYKGGSDPADPSSIYWVRVGLDTRNPQLRAFVLEQVRLEGRQLGIAEARALSTALETGAIEASDAPWLEEQVETTIREHRELQEQNRVEPRATVADAGPVDVLIALLALVALVPLIWPGRQPVARLSAAMWLLLLGLLLTLLAVDVEGLHALENLAGLGLGAVGAWYLALAGRGRARFLGPVALTLALVAETLQRTEILAHELAFTLAGLGILGLPFLARGLNRRMGKPGGHFGLFVVVFTLLFVFVDASPETRQESYWLNHISALIVGAFIARGGFHLQSAIRKRVELAPVEGESSS